MKEDDVRAPVAVEVGNRNSGVTEIGSGRDRCEARRAEGAVTPPKKDLEVACRQRQQILPAVAVDIGDLEGAPGRGAKVHRPSVAEGSIPVAQQDVRRAG